MMAAYFSLFGFNENTHAVHDRKLYDTHVKNIIYTQYRVRQGTCMFWGL